MMGGGRSDISHISDRLGKEPGIGAILLLAENYREQRQWALAAEVCRRGLDVYPDNLELRLALGEAQLSLGETSVAEEILLPVVVEIRRLGRVFDVLARVYRAQGREPEARQAETLWGLLTGEVDDIATAGAEPATAGGDEDAENDFWNLEAAADAPPATGKARTVRVLEQWREAVRARKTTE